MFNNFVQKIFQKSVPIKYSLPDGSFTEHVPCSFLITDNSVEMEYKIQEVGKISIILLR
jgi:hypothetical protein